jgi:hypothetical protein
VRRRRWYRKKRWLVPLGLLLAYALLPRSAEEPSVPGSRRTASNDLNAPARDGQLEFVVTSWKCGVRRLGDGVKAYEPDGGFCVGTVSVTNIGDEPRTLLETFQKLRDKDDKTYSAEYAARAFYPDQTLWDELDPGDRATGTMVFDVPTGADPARLELHDGWLSGGARVRLP